MTPFLAAGPPHRADCIALPDPPGGSGSRRWRGGTAKTGRREDAIVQTVGGASGVLTKSSGTRGPIACFRGNCQDRGLADGKVRDPSRHMEVRNEEDQDLLAHLAGRRYLARER